MVFFPLLLVPGPIGSQQQLRRRSRGVPAMEAPCLGGDRDSGLLQPLRGQGPMPVPGPGALPREHHVEQNGEQRSVLESMCTPVHLWLT